MAAKQKEAKRASSTPAPPLPALKRWHALLIALLAVGAYYAFTDAGSPAAAAAATSKAPTRRQSKARSAPDAASIAASATEPATNGGKEEDVPSRGGGNGVNGGGGDLGGDGGGDGSGGCVDVYGEGECAFWAANGECENNPVFMLTSCSKSCGCRDVPPELTQQIEAARRAAAGGDGSSSGAADGATSEAAGGAASGTGGGGGDPACVDRDKTGACATWAASGECEKNPAFMKLKCAASCNSCDWLDYKKRCPMPPDRVPAVQAGEMAATFERAVADFGHLGPTVLSRDPWVLSFDHFLSGEEVDALLKHSEGRFERSTASGGRKDDEFVPLKSDIRTSWTTWCDTPACLEDPTVRKIYDRVSNVTRVPGDNFEYMQLLRYLPCPHAGHPDCQFYKRHHDTIPELATMQPGPRVYTFFLYLSDVEEGGGTKFDGGFTVQPAKGKALFWPATKDAEPFVSDDRTHHEALPVTKGIKYAANFWLHQHDYVTPHKNGCTT